MGFWTEELERETETEKGWERLRAAHGDKRPGTENGYIEKKHKTGV